MTNGANDLGTDAPDTGVLTWAYVAVALAAAAGAFFAINDSIFDISLTVKTDNFEWFAVLYVAAQAIERFLEPFVSNYKAAEVAAAKAAVAGGTDDAAKARARVPLAKLKAERGVTAWAAASVIALILSGILSLSLLSGLANIDAPEKFNADVFQALDVIITGLVIGAGTKPLHDLISRIEKAKDNADPATGTS